VKCSFLYLRMTGKTVIRLRCCTCKPGFARYGHVSSNAAAVFSIPTGFDERFARAMPASSLMQA
jgi:hypothetical protein